jgi:hypothetical protein
MDIDKGESHAYVQDDSWSKEQEGKDVEHLSDRGIVETSTGIHFRYQKKP